MKFGMFGLGAAAPEVARRIAEEQARKRLAGQTEITSRNMDPLMGDGGFPLTRGGQDMRRKASQQNWANMRSQLQARPAADRTTRFAGEMPAAATGSMLSDGAPMQPVKRAGLGSAIGAAMRRKMPELGMMGRGPSGASPNTASSLTSANAPLTREQMARDYNINVPNFGGTGPTLNSSGVPVMRSSEPLSASQPTPSMGAFGRGPVPGSYAARNNMQNAQPNFFESMIGYDPNEMDVSSLQYFFMSPQGRDKSRDRVDLEEAKAKLTSYMEKLNLSPDEQYAIEMSEDPLKAIDARNARQQQMQAVKEMGPEALRAYNAGVFEDYYKEMIKGDEPVKMDQFIGADGQVYYVNPYSGAAIRVEGVRGIPSGSSNTNRFINMSDGSQVFDTQTGNVVAINQKDASPSSAATGGMTDYQGFQAQARLDEMEAKQAEVDAIARNNLSTLNSSIALLEDFLNVEDPEAKQRFEDTYGNWINPDGKGNDLLNWQVAPGSPRANGMAMLEQLGGQAFLQAIPGLRGTGPLSDAEGAKLQAAATRLMNVRQGDDAARKAGEEFLARLKAMNIAMQKDNEARLKREQASRQRLQAIINASTGIASSPSIVSGEKRAEDLTDEELEAMLAGAGN